MTYAVITFGCRVNQADAFAIEDSLRARGLTAAGPKVVEFNVRFGDPEAQVVLPRLAEPLSALLLSAAEGRLTERPAVFDPGPRVGVVLASHGYPESSRSGDVIDGLEDAAGIDGVAVFHAATRLSDGHFETAGGRVLTVVGAGAHGLIERRPLRSITTSSPGSTSRS